MSLTSRLYSRYHAAHMILYRPVGLDELRLIVASGCRAFPPRRPQQPFFYPVLFREYAEQIARDWNGQAAGQAGFVTRCELEGEFAGRYAVQVVGSRRHQELWVPAEHLAELNRHMAGRIEVVAAYAGPGFPGRIDPATNLPVGMSSV